MKQKLVVAKGKSKSFFEGSIPEVYIAMINGYTQVVYFCFIAKASTTVRIHPLVTYSKIICP
jgi:hypothetical protein